jgi:hypothetical protein
MILIGTLFVTICDHIDQMPTLISMTVEHLKDRWIIFYLLHVCTDVTFFVSFEYPFKKQQNILAKTHFG